MKTGLKVLACLALCVSASAFAKEGAAINHAPKGATACEELLNQQPYGKTIKRMAAIQLQLSKNELVHKGKQSQRKVEDIGLSAAYDILDKQLQGQLPKEQYKAAHIEIESLVSKVTAKLESDAKKKSANLIALREELIKKLETYEKNLRKTKNKRAKWIEEQVKDLKIEDFDLNMEFKGIWWPKRAGTRLIRNFKNNSVLLWSDYDVYHPVLFLPNGKSYFGKIKTRKAKGGIARSNHLAFVDSDGDLVLLTKNIKRTVDNKDKIIAKEKVSKSKSLAAHSDDGKELIIADFAQARVTTIDNETGHTWHTDLNSFSIYPNGQKAYSSGEYFSEELSSLPEYSSSEVMPFFVNNKLIAIYPEDKSAFVVDIKSGDSQYIDNQFIDEIERLISVDNKGNIYGVAFKDDRKVLEVFKFSPESETLAKAVSKTTLKIDDSGFKRKNLFWDVAVDSSGALIITAERPAGPQPNKDAGFYIYSMATGKAVSNSSILDKEEPWPHRIINYGQNQLLFLAVGDHGYKPFPVISHNTSKPSHIYSAKLKLNDAIDDAKTEKITRHIEEAKAQLQDIMLTQLEL